MKERIRVLFSKKIENAKNSKLNEKNNMPVYTNVGYSIDPENLEFESYPIEVELKSNLEIFHS
jgi:hypothetical protein